MSDDKNLDSNHFCAPVDEFEKFQADSMYEEEDFITLSDIVPPQPPVPDLSNELIEIPYDNEVILSSTQNDIQQCGISAEDHTLENKSLAQALDTAGNGAETLDSTSTSKAPARSGRKRGVKRNQKFREKQTYNNSEKHEEESQNKNYLGVQDSVHSTTADKTDTESRLDTSSATNFPRRTSRERIPNTVRYPLVTETQLSQVNPVKRRPGRPKKIHAENQSNSEPDSTNPENNSISNDSSNTPECSGLHLHNTAKTCDLENGSYKLTNINNSVTTESESDISSKDVNKDTKKRRGRKKKVVASVPINKDEDLETLNGNKTLPESSQNSQLSDSIKHIPNETTDSSKTVIDTGSLNKAEESFIEKDNIDVENDNDADDICLSKLKQSFETSINTDNITTNIVQYENNECKNDNTSKRASKMPGNEDSKYNIEDVVKETSKTDQLNLLENDVNESLLIEDISKRPIRRKVKQTFKYDSESEEDPYANVELSDDDGEPKSRKKGRYYSDDEYVPGGRRGKPSSSSSDSDIELDDEDLEEKKRRKKITKNTDSQTPKKRGRKRILEKETESDVNVINVEDKDLEESSKHSLTVTDETLSMKPPAEAWATSNEFENFIAKKIQGTSVKIQKVTSKTKTQSTPLEIPVLDQNEPKKSVVKSTQTTNNPTTSTGIQTSVPYDIPMKNNINLTSEQSEKACEFLNSVVKTTSELGQLMKDKSEDFMKKKINTCHVTDTFKMDYCVRKSFLLFKLARHNLMQMEEDLAKQYDEFLKNNDLSSCREEVKNIIPKPKSNPKADSDSDCEIVEVKESSKTPKKSEKPKFNAKTVFLNKELSIKIAKKPSAEKKLNIEGRQYVWINDSVMVKKVKPTQSFLAQDSRNKKPPDSVYDITEKIVSNFFENYYRQKALAVCAPFVTTEWSTLRKEYACHYFVASENLEGANRVRNNEANLNNIENGASTSIENYDYGITRTINPKSLTTLCVEVVRNNMCHLNLSKTELAYNNTEEESEKKQPLSLFRLCYKNISQGLQVNKINNKNIDNTAMTSIIPSLKTLCYRSITSLLFDAMGKGSFTSLEEDITEDNEHINEWRQDDVRSEESDSYEDLCAFISNEIVSKETNKAMYSSGHTTENTKLLCHLNNVNPSQEKNILNGMKSLSSLCLNSIQLLLKNTNSCITPFQPEFQSPKTLKYLAYESIRHIICDNKIIVSINEHSPISNEEPIFESESGKDFAINCINTLTEEAFSNLQETDEFRDDDDDYYEPDTGFDADHEDENEWASQVQMQELRSCVTPIENTNINENDNAAIDNSDILAYNFAECELDGLNNINDDQYQDQCRETLQDGPVCDSLTPQIKQEPLDEIPESQVDSSVVKTEPIHGFHGMTIIPESIVTKSEMTEDIEPDVVSHSEPISTTFDRDSFEHFVRANKMVRSMDEFSDDDFNNVFSQSASRVRREHEPDPEAGTDMNMGLLVPQTYEPLPVETVKDSLMESSSDDGKDNTTKKASKKKTDKKARGKLKKGKDLTKNFNKETTIKEVTTPVKVATLVKEKQQCSTEIAILTRRMREKIRQEEKKVESSESESENAPLSIQKGKNKKGLEKSSTQIDISKHVEEPSNHKKDMNIEIQCNSVDSTAQIIEKDDMDRNKFSGFSAIDQNEITTYQKYMKFVYERIIPQDEEKNNSVTSVNVNPNIESNQTRADSPVITPDQPVEILECEPTLPLCLQDEKTNTVSKPKKTGRKKEKEQEILNINKPTFTEQDGWHCYPINSNDKKLYSYCEIPLRKLPESFVETYLEYHDITERDNHDKEVDRLVNLNTLNRSSVKSKKRLKDKKSGSESASLSNSRNVSRSASPANSEHCDELTPSEDESPNIEDEIPPSVAVRATENSMAKNSLMDDHESDSDSGTPNKSKNIEDEQQPPQIQEKRKCGPKSKTKIDKPKELPTSESVMLTADKMMNKELTLLHAPVTLKQELNDNPIVKEPSPKDDSKMRTTRSKRKELRKTLKTEDDSSSEEEKQWVTTKEKLLKRLGKKEDVSVDDAKRAKLVTDFIEKHGGAPGKRRAAVTGGRRSRRKRLEQQKQLRVLSKELFGEPTGGKRGAVKGLFTGRRNIRKVIDKKSLQRSTVLANMEEFERKRRLNARQTMLRELHGCEEGVNVLVINDEVCLEYDFNEHRPVVTVHPFFTKVMKAHQYEGVKFMWDACFESLSCIEAGHAGGGCILAHCMGLGKTLQVLALLHTVLTHPRVGMQRVLVCCPLSTVLNWVDEIHKWIGPVTDQIKVFELSKLKKTYERAYQLEDWYNGGGIFIIGYELFRSLTTLDPVIDDVRITIINKIRTALLDPGPDIIICDEGHLLKNDCSVLAVAMSRVVTKRRIILTGTPMQNNLREYYCMVNFVKPDLLGTYSEYSNRFENPIMNGQHRDSQEEDIKLMKARTHILHKVLEGCLQRQEASVLYPYLPKKHEYTVFIPLTKCQWDLYKHYVHHYTKKSKQSVLKDFHILQKIWSHPQVLHNFQIKARDNAKKKDVKLEKVEDDLALEDNEDLKPPDTETWWLQYVADGAMLNTLESSNKFIAVFRILNECISLGDKVLIFSTSLFCLDALEYFLQTMNGWSLGQEYYRLDGSVPPEVRQKWCREFNAENNVKTKLFLISTRAGCLGLNMTAANRVIILDTSWNPAHDIQSIFRVYRFGQKKDCYIYRLVAMGTMEQKIYERAVTKQAVACRVVDEQQIDRHYNMAELTELYRFDEAGASVAGGVAVGVSDVALLRVARDEPRAVHAVHEHDSLLRGSAEPNLPEHERAAAWTQFQQEHAHRQMQNDLDANKAALAQQKVEERLKREEERLKKVEERQQNQVHKIKTEEGPIHDPSLIPQPGDLTVKDPQKEPMRGKKYNVRGRGKKGKTVQCRIPIKKNQERAGPSQEEVEPILEHDDDVREITNLLIKYNFTKPSTGAQEICELVASVKKMVQTGNPVNLGKGSDELTASIASVLMKRQVSLKRSGDASPAVDVSPEPVQQRPKPKSWQANLPDAPLPIEETGRPRRLAAISAEKSFEKASELNDDMSQDSEPNTDDVIQLDDDWIASDTDSVPETPVRKPPSPVKKFQGCKPGPKSKKKALLGDSSIVLSDDETPSSPATSDATPASKLLEKLYPNIPISRKSNAGKVAEEKPTIGKLKEALEKPSTAPTVKPDPGSKEEPVALHPSLLTNQNFIMLVAHTYLAGNPMLDEDAATLAAQYSTFKALKEFQTTGKPIDSGPIYDIAIQVFGKENMKKLHEKAHPISSSTSDNVTIPKLLQNLGQQKPAGDENHTAPSAPVANKLIGPKSRVTKNNVVQAPEVPKSQQQQMPSVVPIGLVRTSDPPTASPAPREECILPDDEVECVTPPVDRFKLKPKSLSSLKPIVAEHKTGKFFKLVKPQSAPVRVSAGASASASYATICLDSDEEDAPTTAPAPPLPPTPAFTPHVRSHTLQIPKYPSAAGAGPVPVALTGPNSQPIPLTLTTPPARAPPPAPPHRSEPVPVSLVGPDARFVPITLAGPGFQSYPISMTGPDGRQTSIASGRPGIVVSVPSAMPAPSAPAPAPAPSAPVIVRVPTSQPAGSVAEHLSSNIYLVPISRSEPVSVSGGLTRLTAAQVPTAVRVQASQVQVPGVAPSNRTYLQPGMRLQLDRHGRAVLLPVDEIHVIPDETTAPLATTSTAPAAKPSHVAATSALAKTAAPVRPQTSNPSARQPPPKALTPPQTKSPDRIRKVSSSSSGDSDSSRASSPSDPLSILKDVVHIQAPERRQPRSTAADRNKPPVKTTRSTTNKSVPNNLTETTLADIRKTDISEKLSKIIASVKKRVSESASVAVPGKTIVKIKPPVNAKQSQGQIKDTVDLTDQPSKAGIVKAASQRAGKSAQITKKDVRATVVGTSKNIILDGKSKSLTNMSLVDLTGQNKNVNVTNVKTINIKAEKRAAPPPEIRTKKKKTELMTLKDFDIDDIDDIIELD